MTLRRLVAAALALGPLLTGARDASATIPAHIRRFETVRLRSGVREADGARLLRLRAFGRAFVLELEPSPLLAPGAQTVTVTRGRRRTEASERVLFHGRVTGGDGRDDSSVRVALRGAAVLGSVRVGAETFYLEPLRRYEPDAAADLTLVYRASDLDAASLPPPSCAAAPVAGAASPAPSAISTTSALASGDSPGLLELTLVADAPFFARHGADSAAAMQVVVDRVAELLARDAHMVVSVEKTIVYETPADDPLTTSTDTFDLVASLNALVQGHPDLVGSVDALHLFTGRELDGPIAGIAYIGSVCTGSPVSLSQDYGSDLHVLTLLAGHELGHTLGAWHDGETGPCAQTPPGYIMWPSLEGAATEALSGCSRETIAPVVERAACITDAIPPGCGDGVVGAGEQCDDTNDRSDDCCRVDCQFASAGTPCIADADSCTADLCDGAGACTHEPAESACDDGDACTTDGRCSEGLCSSTKAWKPLSSARLKARFGPGAGDDRLQIRAALPASLESPPTVAGIVVRFLDESGRILGEVAAPASLWADRQGTGRRYSFESAGGSALLAATTGASRSSLRYAPSAARAKLRMTLSETDAAFLAGRSGVGLQVLVGDAAGGDCGTVLSMYCQASADRLSCD